MKETAPQVQRWKRRAITILQAILAVAVLAFVFHNPERRREVAEAVRHASVTWLAAGVLCYGVVEMLGALRWKLLLRVQGFRLPWRRALAIFLIGLFLLTFTPGLIGGDAARVLYVIREVPERKADAVLVVAMDRLMGLVSLMLLAALTVLCRYHWLAMTPATSWLEYATLLILAGCGGTVVLSVLAARLPWLSKLERHPAMGSKLREIAQALRAYRRHWPRLIEALINTIAAHLFYFATFYCAARALGAFDGPGARPWHGFWDMFCIMPIVNTLTGLPIGVAGIGIRESLFQVLLNDLCAIPAGVGAAIGSLGFAMRAVWGLPGVVLLLRYRSSARRRRTAA
ncbi:MAG: lysylphosphatidylglycerol synthase transmembrane domain-containing protein [Chthoniobacteraceae bacterium]|jgi:uncharacterized membrane protein YbhN (UPF0104 family)